LLGEAIATVADVCKARNFTIVSKVPEGRFALRGDPVELRLAFQNVIHNAILHGHESGTLTIRAQEDGDFLEVAFSDDGPGITPEVMEYVRLVLHQVDPRDAWGTGELCQAGVGLWIVSALVGLHGGQVNLESPLGENGGTSVTLRLPTAQE
jgi:signal transduction histidine kinase